MVWAPRVTVAAIIEQDRHFLLVREQIADRILYNQPAGHLDEGESLLQAVVRETREETRRHFTPEALLGVYHTTMPDSNITYLRFAFIGTCSEPDTRLDYDSGILGNEWLTPQALQASAYSTRSPLVLRCMEDYLKGQRFPLEILRD